MTFTADVKEELARTLPSRRCCRLAELSALLHLEGALHLIGPHRLSLHTESENAAVARKIFTYLKDLFGVSVELRVEKAARLRGHNCYCHYLEEGERSVQILNEIGLIDNSLRPVMGVPARITRQYCCGIAYLRGAFLGGGYVSRPDQPAHMEINLEHAETAEGLMALMERYSLRPHLAERQGHYVIYSKSRGEQADFLALCGAHKAVLRLENEAVLHDIREKVNRRVNCDTANLERAIGAAQNQLRDIKLIESGVGFGTLPASLKDIAETRMSNPEASLKELGDLMDPPISKSAVYHRLLRIHSIASHLS
jgi:DNA-binding protein WhiA